MFDPLNRVDFASVSFLNRPESFDFQAAGLSSGTVNLHRHKSI